MTAVDPDLRGLIEAGCRAVYGRNWDGPPEKRPGPEMQSVWRDLVAKAQSPLAATLAKAESAERMADDLVAAGLRILALSAEVERLRAADQRVRAEAAELAGVLCYVSAYDDPKALRDLCWKAGAFLEKHVIARAALQAIDKTEGSTSDRKRPWSDAEWEAVLAALARVYDKPGEPDLPAEAAAQEGVSR